MTERARHWFDTRGLGWQIVIALAVLSLGALSIGGVAFWLRDALSDFLTANVEVWHLLVAVGTLIVVGLIVMRLRRSGSTQERVSRRRYAPKEIKKYDVIWLITVRWYDEPEFQAGRPRCLKCRTALGLDFGEGTEPFSLPKDWKDMLSKGMTFRCPRDGLAYDLTKYNRPMLLMTKNVEDQAEGEYVTALREAGQ